MILKGGAGRIGDGGGGERGRREEGGGRRGGVYKYFDWGDKGMMKVEKTG